MMHITKKAYKKIENCLMDSFFIWIIFQHTTGLHNDEPFRVSIPQTYTTMSYDGVIAFQQRPAQ